MVFSFASCESNVNTKDPQICLGGYIIQKLNEKVIAKIDPILAEDI